MSRLCTLHRWLTRSWPTPNLAVAVTLALLGGCAAEIGDSCANNVECSPSGRRICDTAQPEGYCTVEGCGPTTCPDESVCVGFFPAAFLSVPCDPATEDAVNPAVKATNVCTNDEICLGGGYCAAFSLERRFCMKRCDDDSDCRAGYECRRVGTAGAEAVRNREDANPGDLPRFCAQRV